MDLRRTFRRKRPRVGCVVFAVLAAPCLSCSLGFGLSTIPAPDPMPREAVMESFALERAEAERLGFVVEQEHQANHERADSPDRHPLTLGPGECVAVIAGVWGSQSPRSLSLRRVDAERSVTSTAVGASRVAHLQWCAERSEPLEVELERSSDDFYARDGYRSAGVHIAVMRASSARVGGNRRLTRGRIVDAELRRMSAHVLDAADAARPAGARLLGELRVEGFSARLIPEDAATYGELHRGALNGSSRVVRPRFTPLPETAMPGWRPGVVGPRAAEVLRAQVRPTDAPGELHPAVRETRDGMRRVLAVIDADRLGVGCAEVQWVRGAYGYRAQVEKVRAGRRDVTALRSVDNAAFDRLCRGDGVWAYVARPTDGEAYTLRLYEGR